MIHRASILRLHFIFAGTGKRPVMDDSRAELKQPLHWYADPSLGRHRIVELEGAYDGPCGITRH